MKKKKKIFRPGEARAIVFNLYHNGLFRHKVIKNKKKELKKFNLKKELSPYLSILYVKKYLNKGLIFRDRRMKRLRKDSRSVMSCLIGLAHKNIYVEMACHKRFLEIIKKLDNCITESVSIFTRGYRDGKDRNKKEK